MRDITERKRLEAELGRLARVRAVMAEMTEVALRAAFVAAREKLTTRHQAFVARQAEEQRGVEGVGLRAVPALTQTHALPLFVRRLFHRRPWYETRMIPAQLQPHSVPPIRGGSCRRLFRRVFCDDGASST